MNAMQVATLATRVVGLFLLFECIRTIGLAWTFGFDEQWSPLIAAAVLYGLLAGLFLFAGKRVAGLLLGSDSEPETGEAGLGGVQAIAFSVAGLWFLSHALMQALVLGFQVWAADDGTVVRTRFWLMSGGTVAVVLLLTLVGCLLFFGGRGLSVLFAKFLGPGDKAPQLPPREETQPSRVQAVAFSILAVFLFMRGLQGLILAIASLLRNFWTLESYGFWMRSWHWPGALANLALIVLAYFLFRRSRALSVFWHRIQLA